MQVNHSASTPQPCPELLMRLLQIFSANFNRDIALVSVLSPIFANLWERSDLRSSVFR
jgi:hypothetical protein